MTVDRTSLAGKVALVTGGSRGIGKSIAAALGRAGARVTIVSRKEASVTAACEELAAAGIDASGLAINVSNLSDLATIITRVTSTHGGLDILVNNAAVNPVFGPIEQTSPEAFEKIMRVNVQAPLELAKLALPAMRARGGGAILNIASIGGLSPEDHLGVYSVSKAALISLTKVLAREWGAHNIRANVLCPGLVRTDFSRALWQNEDILARTQRQQALQHIAEPDDIAGLALLLCSDAGVFCTGGVFVADGGYTI